SYGGKDYLITIDYYSKWIDVKKLKTKSAKEVVEKWMDIFCEKGFPAKVHVDNNPFI
ncbi:unnamed protein product, partial [Sphagnum compactum]